MLPDDAALISVNDHVVEPADLWTRRLPSSEADEVPRVVTSGGEERWVIGSEELPVRTLAALAADRTRPAARLADLHPALSEPAARLAAMDDDGVRVHTLLPHVIGFAGERLRFLPDGAAWSRAAGAYNDFLAEFCAFAPDRLAGVAIVPLHDPLAASAEVGRAASLGLRGVSIPHHPPSMGARSYADGAWWAPVFDAAAAQAMPVFVHVGSSGAPPSAQGLASPAAALVAGGLDAATAAIDLVCSGTLARRPSLRLVLLEGDAGMLPYLASRISFFEDRRPDLWENVAAPAADALRAQVFASFIHDPVGVQLRDTIGVSQLLWQSDFPHADSYWPHSRARLAELLRDVPDADARAIAGGNARALLGVEPQPPRR
jgi:predicted TIM-barrel fold metal-dependent hydrolase